MLCDSLRLASRSPYDLGEAVLRVPPLCIFGKPQPRSDEVDFH